MLIAIAHDLLVNTDEVLYVHNNKLVFKNLVSFTISDKTIENLAKLSKVNESILQNKGSTK